MYLHLFDTFCCSLHRALYGFWTDPSNPAASERVSQPPAAGTPTEMYPAAGRAVILEGKTYHLVRFSPTETKILAHEHWQPEKETDPLSPIQNLSKTGEINLDSGRRESLASDQALPSIPSFWINILLGAEQILSENKIWKLWRPNYFSHILPPRLVVLLGLNINPKFTRKSFLS